LSFISTAYITCSWKSVVNTFRHHTEKSAGQDIEEQGKEEGRRRKMRKKME
jgi:hypothetical protein